MVLGNLPRLEDLRCIKTLSSCYCRCCDDDTATVLRLTSGLRPTASCLSLTASWLPATYAATYLPLTNAATCLPLTDAATYVPLTDAAKPLWSVVLTTLRSTHDDAASTSSANGCWPTHVYAVTLTLRLVV